MFKIDDKGSDESQEHVFLYCMKVTRLIGTVDETPGCIFLRRITDYEVENNLRKGTSTLGQGGVTVGECFQMERLQTVPGCVNVLREIHTTE